MATSVNVEPSFFSQAGGVGFTDNRWDQGGMRVPACHIVTGLPRLRRVPRGVLLWGSGLRRENSGGVMVDDLAEEALVRRGSVGRGSLL